METRWFDRNGNPVPHPRLIEDQIRELRDRFAMAALTGWMGAGMDFFPDAGDEWKNPAEYFYKIADAMLAERNKNGNPIR